jgi:hypothetical protein
VLASVALLLVAGCSKSSDRAPDAGSEAADVTPQPAPPASRHAAAADAAGASAETEVPDIGQAAAPGVAFTYRYAFTLPAKAIAGVQQQHAAACERLGPTRCQVTGMSYDQPRKGEVSARLDLLLAPEVAHSFGSDAIASVEKADGSVDTASLQGDDAGGAIEQSQRRSDALRAQLARLEKRLATPGLSSEEKTELSRRASELRSQLGSEVEVRQQKEASLATTPMSFAYSSEGLFSTSNPFGQAASSSLGSMQAMAAFLLTAAGLLLPWLLLGALVVLLIRFRAMKQRLARATGGAADSAPPQ